MNNESETRRTRSLSCGLVDLQNKIKGEPDFIFDVVIVGSGYGGSVAAQQLAGLTKTGLDGQQKKISVCILERGSEYLPGMFPSSFAEMPGHVRFGAQATGRVTGNHEGLFDIRVGEDVSALVANGLGGGSLINAGVMLEPEFKTFKSGLPANVQSELKASYLAKARALLLEAPLSVPKGLNTISRSLVYKNTNGTPLKYQRLRELASTTKFDLTDKPAEITVALLDQASNALSTDLNACNGCGDCMTGCNVGAKASLDTNLLAQAKRNGAEIYTGASVLKLSRTQVHKSADAQVWELEVVHTSQALRRREPHPLRLKAHKVILAAGTLGSPEILLRSRSEKLAFSNKLGEQFSCNGDNIAAIHKLKLPAHSTDDEYKALDERLVGPTITNMVKVPKDGSKLGFWVQEFAVPAPLKRLFSELVTTADSLAQLASSDMFAHGSEPGHQLDPCAIDEEAIENTLLVGLIGHDSADGSLRLPLQAAASQYAAQEGTLQIVWPQARYGVQIMAAHKRFKEYCEKASEFQGATVIANPMWRLLPDKLESLVSQPLGPVLTVHPLGGCPMGEDRDHGVVDEFGRVFNFCVDVRDDWSESLMVLDGSIVPGSLGANPSLTIAALALRAVEKLRVDWQFETSATSDHAPLGPRKIFAAPEPQKTSLPTPTKVEIVERLGGHVKLAFEDAEPESYFVELTLAYDGLELKKLMSTWGGRCLTLKPADSCIRVFQSGLWDEDMQRFAYDTLRFSDDKDREPYVVWKASLSGTLRFLHREESSWHQRQCRAIRAYFCNRGKRDVWPEIVKFFKTLFGAANSESDQKRPSIFSSLFDALRLATHAGEVRRFDYSLDVGSPALGLNNPLAGKFTDAMKTQKIRGEKRLTYNRRANPWQQLTTLTLTELPLLASGSNSTLKLDVSFLAKQGLPLIRLVRQQNQPNALLDMVSFSLFMTRIMISIHLWTFRKPDSPKKSNLKAKPERLPGHIAGLPEPEITELTVGVDMKKGAPAVVRLTRYAQTAERYGGRSQRNPAPLAMIHGYSVSGTTFTHPSLKPSAAEYFWHQGRDVWVIDLRTSSGMATASLPWSIEEVALVDIPAALLHVKNATGKRVDLIAHCIGAAMTSMALLTDAKKIRNATVQLGVDTWITSAQLGTLAAFNGDGGEFAEHPTVRSIVLSQKGPLLRYTEANIFRAYLMRSLRRWLVPEGYRFEPRPNPKVADQLMDRLLASLPYPQADYDIENPLWPWQTTPWTASRHRMDALYARDFAAANLRPETLDAIDDLFGPINLDTVSQTIHFVRFNCITNQAGRGEFVTMANLKQRWSGIATFAIHGAGNGLVDVSTQTLLEKNFKAAGVPFQKKTYPELEHQDVWIGKTSERVFSDIESFFNTPPATLKMPIEKRYWRFDEPWIGPRMVHGNQEVEICALSSPKYGEACLLLVPVQQLANDKKLVRYGEIFQSACGDSRNWLKLLLTCEEINLGAVLTGWIAVIAYSYDQTTLNESSMSMAGGASGSAQFDANANDRNFSGHITIQLDKKLTAHLGGQLGDAPVFDNSVSENQSDPAQVALCKGLDDWLKERIAPLDDCLIRREHLTRHCTPAPEKFVFALGSCQYPAGLLDKVLAEESLTALARLTEARDQASPDFAIFAGDQIYADASAGLVDPTRSDERFDLPYETALRTKPMRDIMRAMPTHMMLDDHEMVDNWEPSQQSDKSQAYFQRVRRQGLKAYWKYQRMDDHRANSPTGYRDRTSFEFKHGCAAFYMLDSRSQRQYRRPGEPDAAAMFSEHEMLRLKNWLQNSKNPVKFIISPSIFLPRRLDALNPGVDSASRGDAWDGYPASRNVLLSFILCEQIQNVIFLSGDEHLSCIANATLSAKSSSCNVTKAPVQITSIHASGLYAPFPFANSRSVDFIQAPDSVDTGGLSCLTTVQFAPPGSAFACISVDCNNGVPAVSLEFRVEGQILRCDDVFKNTPLALKIPETPNTRQKPTVAQAVDAEMPKDAAL